MEDLVATSKAKQRSERVPGSEEGDDENIEDRVAYLELWLLCVEPWKDEVSGRRRWPARRKGSWGWS